MTWKLSLKSGVRKAAAAIVLAQMVFGTGAVVNATDRNDTPTTTPIKHVVVIFQENVSFDHYFATYPFATNPGGEPEFHARPGTPRVNGLNSTLLHFNLNSTQPFRLDRSQPATCDYSDPLAEQQFLVDTINKLQQMPEWHEIAVIISYDDSDGWYDHVVPPIVSTSQTTFDSFSGPGQCGTTAAGAIQGRCGYGPRLPLLVISPFARENYVDNSLTDQSSILRFIEDNWQLGRIGGGSFDERAGSLDSMFDFRHPRDLRLFLDPTTGQRRNHNDGD